jgi:hypothetical protein
LVPFYEGVGESEEVRGRDEEKGEKVVYGCKKDIVY